MIEAMEKDPNIINTADEGGATMLHWACLHGANVMVSRLLDMGHAVRMRVLLWCCAVQCRVGVWSRWNSGVTCHLLWL